MNYMHGALVHDIPGQFISCDIDSTISDDRWRRNLLEEALKKQAACVAEGENDFFDPFHERCGEDMPFPAATSKIVAAWEDGANILFNTARTEKHRTATTAWLKKNIGNGVHFMLAMRGNRDHSPNWKVKWNSLEAVDWDLPSMQERLTIIDDCEKVLQGLAYKLGRVPTYILATEGVMRFWVPEGYRGQPRRPIADAGGLQEGPSFPIEGDMPPGGIPPVYEALRSLGSLYEARNELYGGNYKKFGALMVALDNFCPQGIAGGDCPDTWNRIGLLVQIASKLSRYCAQFNEGGHPDSLDDLSVYAQMLQEVDGEIRNRNKEGNSNG